MPEDVEIFVWRLCRAAGCYYRQNVRNYSLTAFDSPNRVAAGVFAWVRDTGGAGPFSIAAHRNLVEQAGMTGLADREVPGKMVKSRNSDFNQATASVYFFVEKGSEGADFDRAVTAMKALMELKKHNPSF